MRRDTVLILEAISRMDDRLNTRIDRLHERIDTVIDSIADLRRDFDRHTHNGGES